MFIVASPAVSCISSSSHLVGRAINLLFSEVLLKLVTLLCSPPLPSFSFCFICVLGVHPYISIDILTALKQSRSFYRIDQTSIWSMTYRSKRNGPIRFCNKGIKCIIITISPGKINSKKTNSCRSYNPRKHLPGKLPFANWQRCHIIIKH